MDYHKPVLLELAINMLGIRPDGTYIDATLGGGGHSEAILAKLGNSGKLIGIEQDDEAIAFAIKRLSKYSTFNAIKSNFADIHSQISNLLPASLREALQAGNSQFDGILFDLGVSSHQFDEASRGFSIQGEGLLDMRMDQTQGKTAADIINTYQEKELVELFRNYGNEPFSGRIARVIVENRPINTTSQLSQVIQKIVPKKDPRRRLDSVVRVFQALRIAVNNELENLEKALNDAISMLKPGGRIVVISYHSGEDRIVKNIFREHNKKDLVILTKKPLMATDEEIRSNPRARSAKLRAAEKI